MIDALGTPQIADPAKRLFLKANEVTGDPALATSYLSATGWQTFETYLRANFASLIALRDTRLPNRDIPVFLHTYHHPTTPPSATHPPGWVWGRGCSAQRLTLPSRPRYWAPPKPAATGSMKSTSPGRAMKKWRTAG